MDEAVVRLVLGCNYEFWGTSFPPPIRDCPGIFDTNHGELDVKPYFPICVVASSICPG